MKRLVNGVEVEWPELDPQVRVSHLPDRLAVNGPTGTNTAFAVRVGDAVHVSYKGCQYTIEKPSLTARSTRGVASGKIQAPLPGQVVDVLVDEGDRVSKGEKLVVLEAMKTQQSLLAPFDGIVERVAVTKLDQVPEGALLVHVVADERDSEHKDGSA